MLRFEAYACAVAFISLVACGSGGGENLTESGDAGKATSGKHDAGTRAGGGAGDDTEPGDDDASSLDDAGLLDDAAPGDDAGATGSEGGPASAGGGFVREPSPTTASASAKGTFTVQSYTSGYRTSTKYADSTIYYPTDATPPFASISIVPGFVSPQSSIQNWGPFLASHGIVTITIGTNTGADPPDVRADALIDALETLKSENSRQGGPLAGKLDIARLGIGGWSMGGGGTLIGSTAHPELKAAFSMCAWDPNATFAGEKVPILMFAGTADGLAGGQSQGFYTSVPDATSKLLYEVNGGSHYVANDPAGQGGNIGRYGLSWLKVFLEGDDRYRQFLTVKPSDSSDYRTNVH